jgi:hypothetical protein
MCHKPRNESDIEASWSRSGPVCPLASGVSLMTGRRQANAAAVNPYAASGSVLGNDFERIVSGFRVAFGQHLFGKMLTRSFFALHAPARAVRV